MSKVPENAYPLPGFHFLVEFDISSNQGEHTYDTMFQSVSGLSVEVTTESIKEGSENLFEHQVPVRTKYSPLVLKRGILRDTELLKWCREALEKFNFNPTNATIKLLDEEHNPIVTWSLTHVWPKKWNVSDLDASKNEVLVETLEMNYNFFSVKFE